MTVLHYANGGWTACGRSNTRATEDVDLVECFFCLKRIPIIEDARREQSRLEQVVLDCDAAGLRWLYDRFNPVNASERMLREMVGAIAKYVIETRDEAAAARILAGVETEGVAA